MRQLSLLILLMFTAGCQTGAQKQFTTISADLAVTKASFESCRLSALNRPEYSNLFLHMPKTERVSLSQLADQGKISDADKVKFLSLQSDLQPCRQIRLDGFNKAYPEAASVLSAGYAEGDVLRVNLIQGRMTWGEYNAKAVELGLRNGNDLRQAGHHMLGELNQQHQAELNRRAAIAEAIGAAAQQMNENIQRQQLINSINRPRTTSCNRFGNQVDCTSY